MPENSEVILTRDVTAIRIPSGETLTLAKGSAVVITQALGGSYTIPGAKPDNSYALFNVGASADFGGVTGFITGSGTAARGDGNYYAITVGIRAPL